MKSQNSQFSAELCIFCGGHKPSREHFWPKWTRKLPGEHSPDFKFSSRITNKLARVCDLEPLDVPPTEVKIDHNFKTNPRDLVVWCACEGCNTGWMSDIENKASGIIIPIVEGEKKEISPDEIEPLRSWMTLRIMIMEFLQPETATCKDFEYKALHEHKMSLPYWFFWIGRSEKFLHCSRTQNVSLVASTNHFQFDGEIAPILDSANTRFTKIHLGNMLFCSFSSSALFHNPIEIPFSDRLYELPLEGKLWVPIPEKPLNELETDTLGRSFIRDLQVHLKSLLRKEI